MSLNGLHHLTAITARAAANHDFYTRVLGQRLVKRTVNQDDVSAYHLFYADALASPGSDLTFFDWPAARERRGTNAITRTGLRIAGDAGLDWWAARLRDHGVTVHSPALRDGHGVLDFEDPEGQRLSLTAEADHAAFTPWSRSDVPAEHQTRGLGPVTLSVANATATDRLLTQGLGMTATRQYQSDAGHETQVYTMNGHGVAAELHVVAEPNATPARQGAGGVHHVAFRIADDAYDSWIERLTAARIPHSGAVDRFYFRSLYFREPNGILFEIATDGPGFAADEPLETLGEKLALPPFLEPRRQEIEAGLKPL